MSDFRQFRKDLIQLAIVISVLIDIAHTQEPPSSPLLSALEPKIEQVPDKDQNQDQEQYSDNQYQDEDQLNTEKDKYTLRIEHPDGSSFRNETVDVKFPGTPDQELTVNGVIEIKYPTAYGYKLTVTYETGKNGYRASYKLEKVKLPPVIGVSYSVGVDFLKSAAG